MHALTVLAFMSFLAGAGVGETGCLPAGGGEILAPVPRPLEATAGPELPVVLAEPGEAVPPPLAPRGAWWLGAMVPCPHQRHVYYPTWDTPCRIFFGFPPLGTPALEVPQTRGAPAYWKPIDR